MRRARRDEHALAPLRKLDDDGDEVPISSRADVLADVSEIAGQPEHVRGVAPVWKTGEVAAPEPVDRRNVGQCAFQPRPLRSLCSEFFDRRIRIIGFAMSKVAEVGTQNEVECRLFCGESTSRLGDLALERHLPREDTRSGPMRQLRHGARLAVLADRIGEDRRDEPHAPLNQCDRGSELGPLDTDFAELRVVGIFRVLCPEHERGAGWHCHGIDVGSSVRG